MINIVVYEAEVRKIGNISLSSYKLIADQIISRISDGTYPPGSYLPSENKIAKEFDVTRSTVRKALNILKSKETIESFQGKGYRVSLLYWEQSLLRFYSFSKNIGREIYNSEIRVLSCEKLYKSKKSGFDGEFWRINRLHLNNNVPFILEISNIPLRYLPVFKEDDLKQTSLYKLFNDNEVLIINAKEYLKPALPSKKEQKLLEIESNVPIFSILRYTYNSEKKLVEIRESIIRGDYFEFSLDISL